jgi:MFS family permease
MVDRDRVHETCPRHLVPGALAAHGRPVGWTFVTIDPRGRLSMCSSCGVPTHVAGPAVRKFAALRNRDCRPYLFGAALAMMADNIEHVITYWVLWEKFRSPALTGFEVISHWLPFLFFSVYFGSLADRYDCRRLIQAAQGLFMFVSAAWGVLILTDSLQVWEACVLLVLHGMAGAMWGPGEQLMLHDFVGPVELPSAVRLNATFRSLGILFGPVVGSALLLGLGPAAGIFTNVAFYLPLTLFLFRTRFTGHTRDDGKQRARVGIRDSLRVYRKVRGDHTLVSMIILGGLGSFFVGASLQSSMPIFANDLGAGSAGTAYGVLLFANGAGGVIGGILLEASGRIKPSVPAAVVSTLIYGGTSLTFAATGSYPLAATMLVVGGVANLASMSIGQTIVQLRAPAADRGRVIGLYNMSASGLRAGSGFTVGLLGAAIGIHWSLGLSAAALLVGAALAGWYALAGGRRHAPEGPSAAGVPEDQPAAGSRTA